MFFKPNTHESAVLRASACRGEAKFSAIPFRQKPAFKKRLEVTPAKSRGHRATVHILVGAHGHSVGQGQLWARLPGWVDAIWRQCHIWHSRNKGTERNCGATDSALPHMMVGLLCQNIPQHTWEPGDRSCMTKGRTPPPSSSHTLPSEHWLKGRGHFWKWEQPLGEIRMDPFSQQPAQ